MLAKDGLPIGDCVGFIGFEGSGGSFSIIAFNQDIKHHILLWTFNLMHELLNKLKNKD